MGGLAFFFFCCNAKRTVAKQQKKKKARPPMPSEESASCPMTQTRNPNQARVDMTTVTISCGPSGLLGILMWVPRISAGGKKTLTKKPQMCAAAGAVDLPQLKRNSTKSKMPPYTGICHSTYSVPSFSPESHSKVRQMDKHMNMQKIVRGTPLTMDNACKAPKALDPPARSNAMARPPSVKAQYTR